MCSHVQSSETHTCLHLVMGVHTCSETHPCLHLVICAYMCSETHTCLRLVIGVHTCLETHTCMCLVIGVHMCSETQTCLRLVIGAHTCSETHTCPRLIRLTLDYTHTPVTISNPQRQLFLQHRKSAHRSPSGDVKEPGSPRLNSFPRLMSATIRACTHSCCQDTGLHCAFRSRGTMGACFVPGAQYHPSPRHTAWQPEPRNPVPCFRELGSAVLCTGSPRGALLSQGPPGKLVVSSVLWMMAENQDLNVSGPLEIKSS